MSTMEVSYLKRPLSKLEENFTFQIFVGRVTPTPSRIEGGTGRPDEGSINYANIIGSTRTPILRTFQHQVHTNETVRDVGNPIYER